MDDDGGNEIVTKQTKELMNRSGTTIKFLPLFLSVSHSIPWKNKNAVYGLQICALVPEIFKFEKWVKYVNEMTDDVIHSTQYYLRNRKHVPCFYQVIQTRVEVWENEKCCGDTNRGASVSTAFSSSPKLSRVFVWLDRSTKYMFSISFRKHHDKKKENNLLTSDIKV